MMMSTPCAGTSASACTGEAGCFWLDYSFTACGMTTKVAKCYQCNSTYVVDSGTRSALSNNVGKTCSYPATAPYGASSITINSISQSTDTANCPAMAAASMSDSATITAALAARKLGGAQQVDASTTATCTTQSSGVAALIPSLAFLGLIAVVA